MAQTSQCSRQLPTDAEGADIAPTLLRQYVSEMELSGSGDGTAVFFACDRASWHFFGESILI